MTINRDEFLKYYNMGYNDVKISEVMGCSQIGAWTVRHRLGLPPNRKIGVSNHSKFMEYYNLGYTDCKIAELFGCSSQCIGEYRKKCGLPSKYFLKDGEVVRNTLDGLSGRVLDSILKDYTPSDEDKPWTDPESLFCDGEFLEKIKSKVVEESH